MKLFIKNCFVFVLLASGSLAFTKENVKESSISSSDSKTKATGVKVPCPHCGITSTGATLTDNTNCDNPALPKDRRCDAISKSSQDSQDTSGVR